MVAFRIWVTLSLPSGTLGGDAQAEIDDEDEDKERLNRRVRGGAQRNMGARIRIDVS